MLAEVEAANRVADAEADAEVSGEEADRGGGLVGELDRAPAGKASLYRATHADFAGVAGLAKGLVEGDGGVEFGGLVGFIDRAEQVLELEVGPGDGGVVCVYALALDGDGGGGEALSMELLCVFLEILGVALGLVVAHRPIGEVKQNEHRADEHPQGPDAPVVRQFAIHRRQFPHPDTPQGQMVCARAGPCQKHVRRNEYFAGWARPNRWKCGDWIAMGAMLEAGLRYDAAMSEIQVEDDAKLAAKEDFALVERARGGDMAAFEALVRKYRNQVYALSHHFVRDREDAWDISQEVFVKAYRSLAGFRGEASFKSWLLRITANHCKDQLKRRRLDVVPLDEAIGGDGEHGPAHPDRRVEMSELGRAIDAAVAALPPKHQMAFVLREYQGMSYEEMAKAMDCNLGTVMSRLHHARKKLQEALASMGMGLAEGK